MSAPESKSTSSTEDNEPPEWLLEHEWLLEPASSVSLDLIPQHSCRSSTSNFSAFRSPPATATSSRVTRTVAMVGIGFSMLFGIFCIASGIYIAVVRVDVHSHSITVPGVLGIMPHSSERYVPSEVIRLALTLVVTICTEAIGLVHAATLRSALAGESVEEGSQQQQKPDLSFNTNLRLLVASQSGGFFSPNGRFCNLLMALCLILSYASASRSLLAMHMDDSNDMICLHLCCSGAHSRHLYHHNDSYIAGALSTHVFVWSSSPLVTTAALILHGQCNQNPWPVHA
ncbi:hypothetical protein BT96DRAFT_993201 [Gymnopus androsaceus JB14]|uniref:Uncharacterized protein n=1 Tax=Gymnopus androsaceus JB14 TaxID=1447944 RepID=A0A6A4HQD8_9AGAR|nr:hypothetical protein BT96DRAFT_993201 [Gymnopus androsaceus JB14]